MTAPSIRNLATPLAFTPVLYAPIPSRRQIVTLGFSAIRLTSLAITPFAVLFSHDFILSFRV